MRRNVRRLWGHRSPLSCAKMGISQVMSISLVDNSESISWNPCYRVECIEDEGIFLFSEQDRIFLEGRPYLLLCPFLKEGKYNADTLVDLLQEQVSASDLYYALFRLEKRGFIQAKATRFSQEISAFCGLLQISEQKAFDRLQSTKVFLTFCAEKVDSDFISLLTSLHVQLVSDPNQADFSVVVAKDYLQRELSDFNAFALRKNHPWLLVKPYGSQLWIGPLFLPEETGCHECLAFRLQRNRMAESYVQKKKDLKEFFLPSHAMLASTQKIALGLTATEVFKYIVAGQNDILKNKLLTIDTLTLHQQVHVLSKRPHCTSCSITTSHLYREPSPLLLASKKKEYSNQGGYRCLSAEETFEKYSSQISPITGVVLDLECVSNSPTIHVYAAGANRAIPDIQKGRNVRNFRAFSGGKGVTDVEAKAGCLCECIERMSGEFHGDERRIQASFLQLETKAIHPHRVVLYSYRQYQERQTTNPLAHRFHKVSDPFIEDAIIDWSPIWSLTEQCYKYYPTACCYYSFSQGGTWKISADSNGCAAGNCIEEAILQGFFELVERDSIAIWWYNRLQRPLIDLESFQIPYIEKLLKEYEQMGREVWVLDISSDLGIPVFVALSRLKQSEQEKIFIGFGAHLDVRIALLRSLTEMNQFSTCSPFWEENPCDEQDRIDKQIVYDWMTRATIENQPFLKGSSIKSSKDFPMWESPDLLEDIKHCQKIVESQGMEFLVLDQTRAEIGLNVVKVIVPGLRHFWPRFASGRLYEVPVKMQWLKESRKESELNPIGMFL